MNIIIMARTLHSVRATVVVGKSQQRMWMTFLVTCAARQWLYYSHGFSIFCILSWMAFQLLMHCDWWSFFVRQMDVCLKSKVIKVFSWPLTEKTGFFSVSKYAQFFYCIVYIYYSGKKSTGLFFPEKIKVQVKKKGPAIYPQEFPKGRSSLR